MRTTESVVVPAPVSAVFPHVARLDAYPAWLRLVHDAALVTDDPRPAWNVELRARVGPFARSKRLRMERTEIVDQCSVAFERSETDGRQHAMWALRVELSETEADAAEPGCIVTMHLAYDGSLWSGPVLGKVLDDEVRRGRQGLIALVND